MSLETKTFTNRNLHATLQNTAQITSCVAACTLTNFRCFEKKTVTFDKPITILKGPNGSGKTSLIEALHYACYLKSFKTRNTHELIKFNAPAFSLKLTCADNTILRVGYATRDTQKKHERSVKINDTRVETYQQLVDHYRVITCTDDDTALITGTSEERRTFLDQTLTLLKSDFRTLKKRYNALLLQRNAFLQQKQQSHELYDLWTEKLLAYSALIRNERQELLSSLEKHVHRLGELFFCSPATQLNTIYVAKEEAEDIRRRELAVGHSLMGAHLDDIIFKTPQQNLSNLDQVDEHNVYPTRRYASKGQQKLLTLLFKCAQLILIRANKSKSVETQDNTCVFIPKEILDNTENPCLFLLDDVLADLDTDVISNVLELLLAFKTQIILTTPHRNSIIEDLCTKNLEQITRIITITD